MGSRVEYKVKKLFEVKPYKFKELCSIYQVHPSVLRRWISHADIRISLTGGYYKIPQVEAIIEKIGMPYLIYDIDFDSCDIHGEKREFKRPFEVRPYKTKELSSLYNVTPPTFRKWIIAIKDELGAMDGDYYTIPQIAIIIKHIGLPYFIYEEEEKSKVT